MTLLKVEGLLKSFGGVTAIADLDFEVPEGVVYSIIGPNGAGKTTLFNMLSGIYIPDEGSISLNGKDMVGLSPHKIARSGVARTFQNLQIFFNMSVLENVLVGCHLRIKENLISTALRLPMAVREEAKAKQWAIDALNFCGLGEYISSPSDALSYGVLKRMEIARALAMKPSIIMMDEPAAGLNDTETAEMLSLIRRISESGITVLLVEHNMNLVMQVSDRVLVLDYGSRLAEGSTEEIQNNPQVIAAYLGTDTNDGVIGTKTGGSHYAV
ncbi:MAG: ABC transporter ATP-binding protein [Gammaproteobacteria bacterium]|nr:ABC transporter ATP-binding protein [Gammaproteobacteria bacterium]